MTMLIIHATMITGQYLQRPQHSRNCVLLVPVFLIGAESLRVDAGSTVCANRRPVGPVIVAKAYRLQHAIFETAAEDDRVVARNAEPDGKRARMTGLEDR